jgi:hypothetical protein
MSNFYSVVDGARRGFCKDKTAGKCWVTDALSCRLCGHGHGTLCCVLRRLLLLLLCAWCWCWLLLHRANEVGA